MGRSMTHHLSDESRSFAGSTLKRQSNPVAKCKLIPLGTGRPGAELYPWEALSFHVEPLHRSIVAPGRNSMSFDRRVSFQAAEKRGKETDTATSTGIVCSSATPKRIGHNADRTIHRWGGEFDLAKGLNYGTAAGSQPLVRFFTEHVELVHDPPYRDWSTCLSCGATSAMEICMRMLCNKGDTILTERYTYPGTIEGAQLIGLEIKGIGMDAEGIIPEELREVLDSWNCKTDGPRPRLLYTIPSGQNPTGATQPLKRKQAVYSIAEEFDMIIIEDDPYYFINLDASGQASATTNTSPSPEGRSPTPADLFIRSLPPSYLSLDRSGRVIRLDSTSKILAPGLRAGWTTAPAELIDKFRAYTEVSTVSVSGPSQLMLWHLFEVVWRGHEGFFHWLSELSREYQRRMEVMVGACERFLPRELCTWRVPQNGMFLWIAVDLRKHPHFAAKDGGPEVAKSERQQIESRIYATALQSGVQFTIGSLFDTVDSPDGHVHLRLTCAAAAKHEIAEGVEKVARAVKKEFEYDDGNDRAAILEYACLAEYLL